MSIQVKVGGVTATIVTIRNLKLSQKRVTRTVVNDAGKRLVVLIKHNMRSRKYTLQDLDRMDHPYARRHGSIRVNSGSLKFLADGRSRVQTHTGTLLDAVSGKLQPGHPATFKLGVDLGVAPHAEYVIQGTRHMLPRDVLWDTATSPGAEQDLVKTIVKTLGKKLRAQAAVRFTSGGMP